MSSFFELELDTTAPEVTVYSPNYTLPNIETEIIIESNETVDEWQDVYIMDSKGTRHDLIFLKSGENQYTGKIYFSDYPLGIARIYAQLRDEVFNLSNIAIETIEIKPRARIFIISEEQARNIDLSEAIRNIDVEKYVRDLIVIDKTRVIEELENTRNIEVSVK